MPDTPKFDFREWLVPPLLPMFCGGRSSKVIHL
jgi:hypothetical protein